MSPAWIPLVAAAAGATPAMEGRDLYGVADPAFEGNGPGAGLFVEARDLGEADASLGGTFLAGWTWRPIRLAVAVPGEASTDHVDGLPPRLDALFVLSDRRKGGLGVAGAVDVPLPFFPGKDRPAFGRLSLGVGKSHTAVVVNLGAPIGTTLTAVKWSVGAGTPFVGALGGFAEAEGNVPIETEAPAVGTPWLATIRAGLRLTPARPIAVAFAIEGHPDDLHPSFTAGVAWIPQPRPDRPKPLASAAPPDEEAAATAIREEIP